LTDGRDTVLNNDAQSALNLTLELALELCMKHPSALVCAGRAN